MNTPYVWAEVDTLEYRLRTKEMLLRHYGKNDIEEVFELFRKK